MINKKVDDAVLDAILARAFSDEFAQEMEELEKEPLPKAELPARYRKAERRYYRRRTKKTSQVWQIVGKIAACVVLCLSIGISVVMISPTIRAAVWDTIVAFYEKYVAMDFSYEATKSVTIGDYTMGYVPKGFLLGSTDKSRMGGVFTFVNKEGESFTVNYYNSETSLINYEIESSSCKKIQLNENDAYMVQHESGLGSITWEQDGISFSVEGYIQYTELKKVAENIAKTVVS